MFEHTWLIISFISKSTVVPHSTCTFHANGEQSGKILTSLTVKFTC